MRSTNALLVLMVGMSSTLIGIGLSRFAFTPLIPMLSSEGWFSVIETSYLGSLNLLGYLIGALSAHRLAQQVGDRLLLTVAALVVSVSYFVCFLPIHYLWVAGWRVLAGVAGGHLMVIGPAFALLHSHKNYRNAVMTMIFMGIGLGVVLSSAIIPLLLRFSLSIIWLAIGSLSLCISAVMIFGLRQLPAISHSSLSSEPSSSFAIGAVWLVIAAYALDAAGFIPHTIFWVDYLVRERNFTQPQPQALWFWFAFGGGCLSGPLMAKWLVSRFSWHRALWVAYALKAAAILLPVLTAQPLWLFCSAFIVGAMTPGIVALTAGRIAELVGTTLHSYYWGKATAGFALLQAISGGMMAYYYQHVAEYIPLFTTATLLMLFALLCISLSPFFHSKSVKQSC
ncbi:YbfB/YjiJ family MFS transporter [Vibrio metschnikovii]|uniref:YbfB/YjiJ family MFS transporter n=1 Tax=Vibrio metschnikovii TaxID=28172 RepID=A0A9X0R6M3_VIBME|nr:YbfB/YjiJ family MFS transporter [Vibrio metschnikovii]MBC5850552.1 YbfB/YjiJ family MFS transporter [Vibrio metschnikovii]